MSQSVDLIIEKLNDGTRVSLKGEWIIEHAGDIVHALSAEKEHLRGFVELDLSGTKSLDTFGALILLKRFGENSSRSPRLLRATDAQRATFELVNKTLSPGRSKESHDHIFSLKTLMNLALAVPRQTVELLSFLGEIGLSFFAIIRKPPLIRPRELVAHLQQSSINAIPIISLVTFLIGIVVAYLFVSQASQYGADVYIAEVVSIGMFREFSPIIVAVIMAGRSGSAYTAQIGTMKMNEEIDAIKALGLSPLHVLVVPRVLSLMISMPLLVFVGDLVGIGGGMLISYNFLGLTPLTFLSRLHTPLCRRSLIIGLIKAPVFALFIATIGCKLGFSAGKDARSVGLSTTSSVVQSVVWVIILDALFAVILQKLEV